MEYSSALAQHCRPPNTAAELFDQYLPTVLGLLATNRRLDRGRRPIDRLHVTVRGDHGGDWTIDMTGHPPSCVRGLHGDPTRKIMMATQDLQRLLQGRLPYSALADGVNVSIVFDPPPRAELTASDVSNEILGALEGTTIKLDHTQNLPVLEPGVYSFVDSGAPLQALGLASHALDVPLRALSTERWGPLTSLASGGLYNIGNVRMLVNNLRAKLGRDTTTVTLVPGAILIDMAFTSNSPTLIGEAFTYAPWFLFGIPLGWLDISFPDFYFGDFGIVLRLAPYVTGDGRIGLPNIGVDFRGKLYAGALEGGEFGQPISDDVRSIFVDVFNTNEFRGVFRRVITEMLERNIGQSIGRWNWLEIEPSGVSASGRP